MHIMALILDRNTDMGAYVRISLCYLICVRHFITSRAVTNQILVSKERPIFLHACAKCSELPSNKITMMQLDE